MNRFRPPLLLLVLLLAAVPAFARDADTATAHYEAGEYERALEAARDWAKSEPRAGDAWYMQGMALLALDRADEAVRPLRRSTDLAPDDAYNWGELGRAELLVGDRDAALEAWSRSLALDGVVYGEVVSRWYTADQDAVSALAAVAWTEAEPKDHEAWFVFGASLLFLDRADEALPALRRSLDLLEQGAGDEDLDERTRRRAFVQAHLGFALHATGDPDGAVDAWRACARLARSECKDAFEEHYLRDRFAPVLAAGIALREQAPAYDEGWYYEGSALFHLGRRADAVAPLREATVLDDEDYVNHFMLGYALLRSGDPSGALAPLERALALESSDADVHDLLAEAYEAVGRESDAARMRREAVRVRAED